MTIAEFIRLRPAPDDNQANVSSRSFVCELPDIEGESSDTWLDCGRIRASASDGRIKRVDVDLNEAFISQFDDGHYDPEEVLGVIVLWIGWEANWAPMERVRIHLCDGRRTLDRVYTAATDRVTRQPPVP